MTRVTPSTGGGHAARPLGARPRLRGSELVRQRVPPSYRSWLRLPVGRARRRRSSPVRSRSHDSTERRRMRAAASPAEPETDGIESRRRCWPPNDVGAGADACSLARQSAPSPPLGSACRYAPTWMARWPLDGAVDAVSRDARCSSSTWSWRTGPSLTTVGEAVLRTELLEVNDPRWAHLAASHPNAIPFHHPAWVGLVSDCYRFRLFRCRRVGPPTARSPQESRWSRCETRCGDVAGSRCRSPTTAPSSPTLRPRAMPCSACFESERPPSEWRPSNFGPQSLIVDYPGERRGRPPRAGARPGLRRGLTGASTSHGSRKHQARSARWRDGPCCRIRG